MLKEKVKKLFKDLLCASMLLTGFILNPVKANAEEAGTYANPIQSWTETLTEVVDLGTGGTVTVMPVFRFTKSQTDTSMTYVSVTCSMIGSGTCSITKKSISGYSSLNSTEHLVVTFKITTTVSGSTKDYSYEFVYYKNQLEYKQRV